jgi:hypothetical protein
MPTTIQEIAGFLDNHSVLYDIREQSNDIISCFRTSTYIDKGGDYILPIIILLEEDGRFIKMFVPNCYSYKDTKYPKEFFQTLLTVSFHTKMLQFECDQESKTIYAMIEFPLEDAILTEKQLMRSLNSLASLIDRFDETIRLVLATGEIQIEEPREERMMELFLKFMSDIEEKEGLEQVESDSDEEWI